MGRWGQQVSEEAFEQSQPGGGGYGQKGTGGRGGDRARGQGTQGLCGHSPSTTDYRLGWGDGADPRVSHGSGPGKRGGAPARGRVREAVTRFWIHPKNGATGPAEGWNVGVTGWGCAGRFQGSWPGEVETRACRQCPGLRGRGRQEPGWSPALDDPDAEQSSRKKGPSCVHSPPPLRKQNRRTYERDC